MTDRRDLVEGEYYWVLIVLDVDALEDWENEPVPARYAGSENGEDLWYTINGDRGIRWPVRWIGDLIPRPVR